MTGRPAAFAGGPPGLEAPSKPPPGLEGEEQDIEELRAKLLLEVDARVGKKIEELWAKGQHMMLQAQTKQQEKVDQLVLEVQQCLERQSTLELENQHLKQVLGHLAGQLTMIGAGFVSPLVSCIPGTPGPCLQTPGGATATTATGPASRSPLQAGSPSESMTPLQAGAPGELGTPLPEVPAFPFSQPAAATARKGEPLSLTKALEQPPAVGGAAPLPLPLAEIIPVTPTKEASRVFFFTLRKADGTELGLNVSHSHGDQVLTVDGIRQDGAVDAWNRLCNQSATPERMVRNSDQIIRINDVYGSAEKMLEECRTKQLLKLWIVRGGNCGPSELAAAGIVSPWPTGASGSSGLRAGASEFVPSASPPPSTSKDGEGAAATEK